MGKAKARRWAAAALMAALAAAAAVSAAALAGAPNGQYRAGRAAEHFIAGSREARDSLKGLFELLDAPGNSPEQNFAAIREIAGILMREGEHGRAIRFLGGRAVRFPDDPFNSHHLLMIAYAHERQGSPRIAAMYFDLIVKNYPDLDVGGSSIHLASLLRLIELDAPPERQAWRYRELLARFPDYIDRGVVWFRLAQAYERIGNWDGAIQAYAGYLASGGPPVPGFPNAQLHARQQVSLSGSSRDWAFETLPELAAAVRHALNTGNADGMRGMQAGAGFFTRSWGQDDIISRQPFNMALFLRGARIRHADRFHERSGESEAFLRTWGWPQAISVWYLYFRRIHFPADPQFHGRWEWAGIYFGES